MFDCFLGIFQELSLLELGIQLLSLLYNYRQGLSTLCRRSCCYLGVMTLDDCRV